MFNIQVCACAKVSDEATYSLMAVCCVMLFHSYSKSVLRVPIVRLKFTRYLAVPHAIAASQLSSQIRNHALTTSLPTLPL